MLHDCTEPTRPQGMPCFNWKNAARSAAQLADGLTCGARGGVRRGGGGGGGFVTRAPSNGTLAAVFTCAGRMGESIGARQGRARGKVHDAVLTTYYTVPPAPMLSTHNSLLTTNAYLPLTTTHHYSLLTTY